MITMTRATDATGKATIVVKGLKAGETDLTVKQSAGTHKTSGLSATAKITIATP